MHQTADAASQIDKRAVRHKAFHHALHHRARRHHGYFMPALLGFLLSGHRFAGKNHLVFLPVNRNHLHLDLFSDPGLHILHIVSGKLGSGYKGSHAFQPGYHAALHALLNANLYDGFLLQHGLQPVPGKNVVCFFSGKLDIALPIVHFNHRSLNLVAHGNFSCGKKIGIVAQILRFDDSLGIVFQIENDLFLIHVDHRALDDIALINPAKGSLQLLLIVFHRFRRSRFCRFLIHCSVLFPCVHVFLLILPFLSGKVLTPRLKTNRRRQDDVTQSPL